MKMRGMGVPWKGEFTFGESPSGSHFGPRSSDHKGGPKGVKRGGEEQEQSGSRTRYRLVGMSRGRSTTMSRRHIHELANTIV